MASLAKRVPIHHGQVRKHPKYGPVFIMDGGPWRPDGKVSNQWTFRKVLKDGRLSAQEYHDYGDTSWPNAKGVEIRVTLKKDKPKRKSQPRVLARCGDCGLTYFSRSKVFRCRNCGRPGRECRQRKVY